MPTKYCFDTNAFIEPWNKHYRPSLLPAFWDKLDLLIHDGRVICPFEVYEEILKRDDSLASWIKKRKDVLVRPYTQDLQQKVRDILQLFPKLIKVQKNQSMADPWVIAQAMVDGAIVVTKEIAGFNTDIRIPNVCTHFQIEFINEFDFAQRENIFT